ncbi:neuralized-like protein 4 isoform X1 [Athalia rosae]|uniref:neuralized-like protein 4 isoform X1 n=2 Tax=Athalia rosae TaxID=37344 RepID=UPI002034950E|nr:neuralized-like protein 4 isoform X1 [Athalia rosae]
MAEMFHPRCGDRVSLINDNCTAVRNFSVYNYGLVLSSEPLKDDQLFEVRIDKKMVSWSGSIEIGVTSCDPESMELPACANKLRLGSWIMSGTGITRDGQPIVELYGTDLHTLEEGDTLGVMRTSNNELVFYVNGISQGVAAVNIPPRVFAVIDMYGNCVQVTVSRPRRSLVLEDITNESEINNDHALGETSNSLTTNLVTSLNVNVNVNLPKNPSAAAIREDRLRFHERVGTLVKLSNNARTAERQRPFDEFNNGVVMTHRALRDNELFEIRIDRLVGKWSGSIEVGVTTHSPTALEFPATMTNMRSGTTMMSGCGILTNGKGTRREYGEFNLDELREGDRVGMIRRSNGNLHYLINGLDQGIAAKIPSGVWGVIDLYGMTVKVTIVDRDEKEEQNLVTRRNTLHLQELNGEELMDDDPMDRLMFHVCCGTHADVINNGRTAHRSNALDDYNNGAVLTSRPLRPNELFEVKLDKIVTKWSGSIEIGVTTHAPTELEFPYTMTNLRSGTWMMTGTGVMHNGTTIIDKYGPNLDHLQVGDRVGVMRNDDAILHFYVNGADLGAAATGVPDRVYGVIDLYGQAAQATIVDATDFYSPTTNNSSFSNTTLYSDLRFHHIHGKNARIMNNGLTAARPRALGEFNEAIVIANRALRDGEMFEVSIDKMVPRWSGAIEAGVTAIRPDELEFPSTMTDIDHDTWMLSGSAVMRDGVTLRHNYACDLDNLVEGNRVGIMRLADTSLHYYLDGIDQGIACTGLPLHVYPVIDLYGRCAQVTIVSPERRDIATQQYLPSENSTSQQPTSVIQPQAQVEITHKFHESVGANIQLNSDRTIAARCREYSNAIILSECPLESNEVFEIAIREVAPEWCGSLRIGIMTNNDGNWFTTMNLVPSMTSIPEDSWYLIRNQVRHKGYVLALNYCPSLDWLRAGDKIGIKRTHDGNLKFYINGEDMGVAATNIPELVYVVVELFGSTLAICATSSKQQNIVISPNASLRLQDSLELLLDPMPPIMRNDAGMDTSIDISEAKLLNEMVLTPTQLITSSTGELDYNYEFHENRGRNIELERKTTARRVASYNQGVVMSQRPLVKGKSFQVKVEKLNDRWVSGMLCGVTCIPPDKASFPLTALGFKKYSWIICGDWISHSGTRVKTRYGMNLESLQIGSIVSLLIDEDSRLHLYINGSDQGIAATDLPPYVYAVIDLYGQCEQVSIIGPVSERAPFANNNTNNMAIATSAERPETENEDVENSREKADLECHEKENAIPATPSNLSLNIPSQSTLHPAESSNSGNTLSPIPSQSDNSSNFAKNVAAMSSSVNSESDNSQSSNDARTNLIENSEEKSQMVVTNNVNENNISQNIENHNHENNDGENNAMTSILSITNECTNVEINNATNINIKNGCAANCSHMSNLSTAITSTNANNAINESIASNNLNQINSLNNASSTSQHSVTSPSQNHLLTNSQVNVSTSSQDSNSNLIRNNQIHNNCVTNSIVANQHNDGHHSLLNSSLFSCVPVMSLPSTPLAAHISSTKKCDYLKACLRFKKSLVLPEEFFSAEDTSCYCSSCFKAEADGAVCRKGEPPSEFAIPLGWVRFPLRQSINTIQIPQNTLDKWHVAFYGTRLDAIRWILDRGELLTKEQLDTSNLIASLNTDDQNPQVVFSPNIKYAASEEFAIKYPYIDTQSNKKLNASTAFQLLVRPGSYTMGPGKDCSESQLETTEWSTKEGGATVIVAFLVHLDGF